MGVATYKISDSEVLGFARSIPLLCKTVIKCESGSSVWLTNLSARPGQGTITPTPTPNPTTPPATKPQVKVATLPAGAARSPRLKSTEQNSVNRQLVLNDCATKFICTGVIATNASSWDRALARARAKAACDHALKRKPSLSTFFQTKVSTLRSAVGKVLLTLKE